VKLDARIVVAFLRVVYRLLLRWTVTGRECVPADGALILIANHIHLADPVLLMLAFPRPITFLAKEELFRIPFVGMIMRHGGMFPVARGGSLQQKRDVMRQAEDLLSQGRVLALTRRHPASCQARRRHPLPALRSAARPCRHHRHGTDQRRVVVAQAPARQRHHRGAFPT
jgi:1-acyl-sn-glycerol-3-phosphate acyltransferase